MAALQAAFEKQAGELGLTEIPKILGIAGMDNTKTILRVGFNAPPNQRPGIYAPKLRALARKALTEANIAIGGP
jgi:hypothetical protein